MKIIGAYLLAIVLSTLVGYGIAVVFAIKSEAAQMGLGFVLSTIFCLFVVGRGR